MTSRVYGHVPGNPETQHLGRRRPGHHLVDVGGVGKLEFLARDTHELTETVAPGTIECIIIMNADGNAPVQGLDNFFV